MRVCLINTPYSEVYGQLKSSVGAYFPLGMGYIASCLLKYGFEVAILDPEAERLIPSKIEDCILKEKPDIVGIGSATPNFNTAHKIAKMIKSKLDIPIIFGGIHASCVSELILKKCPEFDIIILGEGERTIIEICEQYKKNKLDFAKIKGIAYREGGKIIKTLSKDLIEDVDTLPFPARQLVNLENYAPSVHVNLGKKSATILTSRGCPYYCIYCSSYMVMGRKYRPHNAKYVLKEIESLIKKHGITHFVIQDDTFTINKKRIIDICQGIINSKWVITWYCFARVDTLDEELLKKMKQAGCYCIGYGIESGDQQILNNLKKGTTLEKCKETVRLTKKIGIRTLTFFILGSPGETKETLEKTINFALELNTHMAFFNNFTPYPGTETFNQMIKSGQINPEESWDKFFCFGVEPVVACTNLSKQDLQKAASKAYLKFYLRPGHIAQMIAGMKSVSELKTYTKAAIGVLRQNLKI